MRKKSFLVILASCILAQAQIPLQAYGAEQFDFVLYKSLASAKAKENLLYSPYSVSSALTMTYTGANGETKEAMAQVLNLDSKHDEKTKQSARETIDSLQKLDNGTVLEIANTLFANKNIVFSKPFLSDNEKYFYAGTNVTDFSSPDAVNEINDWVKNKTHNRISKILDRVSGDAILYLINAIYFKGSWQNQFKREETKKEKFHGADGKEIDAMMMSMNRNYSYAENQDFQAIYLPYKDNRLGMFVFLPLKGKTLDDFEKKLDLKTFEKNCSLLASRPGTFKMPRFKIEDDMKLKDNLSKLGMEEAFDKTKADFTLMTNEQERVFINDVIHKTFMDVNEEGTEAAAVTAVEMCMTSARMEPQTPFTMTCDRPFFVALQDMQTKKILFMGHINKP
ncbi:MAG: serpin family protein [Candidatus Melainabacteria bacterium]|nr:serpin family protein [Candidatus Melainabacteria bacterium]